MRFSEAWLREWVDPDLGSEQLGHRLTMAGLELDGIEPAAPAFSGVVVARVLEVAPHPDADRLRVCQVDDGSGAPVQVVCGAPDVSVGMRAPLARVGAQLPGGMQIRRARLRGVESFGMLCSTVELGLAESAEGLMELAADAPVGTSLRDYLGLDDQVFEIDLTPNRADCLSIIGLSREVSALTGAAARGHDIGAVPPRIDDTFPVEIHNPAACPRYACRVIRGIDPAATTPVWMQERLRRSGIRSLGPVVDVTNYVMLELGQPMHAFDLQTLRDAVSVRNARQGETLVLLDGQRIELDPATLLITDGRGPLALAGIMGGEHSGITPQSTDLLLESAFFAPQAVAGQARRYGLHTESSHRFERGVDPGLQVLAIERATALLLEIAGGVPGPVVDHVSAEHLPRRSPIVLRPARIGKVLGIAPQDAEVERMLIALGCRMSAAEEGWRVDAPSFRFDLGIEVDLIEEVGRVYGYDRIPDTTQRFAPQIRSRSEARMPVSRVRMALVDRGYQEVITFSFVDADIERLLNPGHEPKVLANPLSSELTVMRSTLWAGLLRVVRHNLNRQQNQIRLFETGLRFINRDEGLAQIPTLSGAISGPLWPEQWAAAPRQADFYDIKGDVEALLELTGRGAEVEFEPLEDHALHPGQAAALTLGGEAIGRLGALHPDVQHALDLEQPVYLFELSLQALQQGRLPEFRPLSRFPAIRRDIAIVVDEGVPAARVLACVRAQQVPQLENVVLFDKYVGKGIPSGRKSLALGLILQDLSRTLTDTEVEDIVSGIVAGLSQELGASLRE